MMYKSVGVLFMRKNRKGGLFAQYKSDKIAANQNQEHPMYAVRTEKLFD